MEDEAQPAEASTAELHVMRLMDATKQRLDEIDNEIGVHRATRSSASDRIKALLNEQKRLSRVMRATEPRKSRTEP